MLDINQKPVGVIQALNKLGEASAGGAGAAFSETDLAMLQLLADQAGVAVQRYRLQQAAMESLSLRREMELARGVQQAMIPRAKPDVPGIDAFGWTRPASINGGDVFDLWKTPDGRLGVLVADASGHGIGPAMVACQVRTLVRSLSEAEGTAADPLRLLSLVNARLCEDLPVGHFVTTFIGFIGSDGVMSWCSGGQGPVLIRDAGGEPVRILEATLPPLGIVPVLPGERPADLTFEAGGSLVVASDGITESFNAAGDMFGELRLAKMIEAHAGRPEDALTSVRSAVWQWQGKEEPQDDQTVVMVMRR
jgi:phosphoserine phosphatase